jgi:hypothetical protein
VLGEEVKEKVVPRRAEQSDGGCKAIENRYFTVAIKQLDITTLNL